MVKRRAKVFAIFISVVILLMLVVYADPVKFASIVAGSNYKLLFVAFVISSISIFLRIIKWKVLLDGVKLSTIIPVQLLGLTLSNFSPGKIGEPIKAIVLKSADERPVSSTLPSIIWERILDVLVLVLLAILGAYSFVHLGGSFYIISVIVVVLFTALLAVGLLILYRKSFGLFIFRFLRRLPFLNRMSDSFIKTFQNTAIGKKKIFYSFLLTLAAWVLEGFVIYYAFLSIGVNLSPFVLASVFALATMIGVASSLPGGIGSTDVVLAIFLASFGVDKSLAITGILLSRFLAIWYLNILGGFSFFYLSKKLNLSMKSIFN